MEPELGGNRIRWGVIDGVPAFSVQPPGPMLLTSARRLGDSNIALLIHSQG